jgi:putative glutamine amidotransferase
MRIALSQRVEKIVSYSEARDCLDQRWHDLLAKYNHYGLAVPNRIEGTTEWCNNLEVEGIILTGGNDISGQPGAENVSIERDVTERALLDYAARNSLPVLAICRGLQFLNLELGGDLEPAHGHVAVDHEINCRGNPFVKIASAIVNSYHNYAISRDGLAAELTPWAESEDGFIEAVSHKQNSWVGIMWHPERSSSILDSAIFEKLFDDTN